MDVRFRSRRLERHAVSEQAAVRAYGPVVGRRFVQRVQILRNVSDFSRLRTIAALRLHALHGDRDGQYALSLTGFTRLVITYDEEEQIVWVDEVSKHYGD